MRVIHIFTGKVRGTPFCLFCLTFQVILKIHLKGNLIILNYQVLSKLLQLPVTKSREVHNENKSYTKFPFSLSLSLTHTHIHSHLLNNICQQTGKNELTQRVLNWVMQPVTTVGGDKQETLSKFSMTDSGTSPFTLISLQNKLSNINNFLKLKSK